MSTPARKLEPEPAAKVLEMTVAVAPSRPMFYDATFFSEGRVRTKMGWTALFSTVVQVILVGFLILMPMLFIDELPRQTLMTMLVAPPPPPPPPPPAAAENIQKVVRQVESELLASGALRTPTKIPEKIKMIKEEDAPPPAPSAGVIGGVPGGIPGGQLGGVIGGIISSSAVANVPKAPTIVPQRVRISQGVSRGMLVQQIKPDYPPMAMAARIQGDVLLHAIISRDGAIENLRVISGHPMLVQSAMDAVKRWRYKPYMLSGEPVEVETEITVEFRLTH